MVDKLSIREAVKSFDVSRPTLTKSLKTGKISGEQDGKGQWSIDPSELSRVYRARKQGPESNVVNVSPSLAGNLTRANTPEMQDFTALQEQLADAERRVTTAELRAEAAETLAKERSERIEDLRRLLPPPHQPRRRSWWHRD